MTTCGTPEQGRSGDGTKLGRTLLEWTVMKSVLLCVSSQTPQRRSVLVRRWL